MTASAMFLCVWNALRGVEYKPMRQRGPHRFGIDFPEVKVTGLEADVDEAAGTVTITMMDHHGYPHTARFSFSADDVKTVPRAEEPVVVEAIAS